MTVEHSDLEAQQWLIRLAATGHVRTRRDAETLRDEILSKGWEKELRPLYRAVLRLLGDKRAVETLKGADKATAMTAYNGMLEHYIGDRVCTCPTIQVAKVAQAGDCPVHGQTGRKVTVGG